MRRIRVTFDLSAGDDYDTKRQLLVGYLENDLQAKLVSKSDWIFNADIHPKTVQEVVSTINELFVQNGFEFNSENKLIVTLIDETTEMLTLPATIEKWIRAWHQAPSMFDA